MDEVGPGHGKVTDVSLLGRTPWVIFLIKKINFCFGF